MTDEIEVHYDAGSGTLYVWCSEEDAFARLRKGVVAEAVIAEAITGPVEEVRYIEISSPPSIPAAYTWRNRLALVGCSLVAFVFVFLLLMGIIAIKDWFW